MNWKRIIFTSLMLVTVGPFVYIDNGVIDFDTLMQAQEDSVVFTIDTAEVEGAATIWTDIFGPRTDIKASSGLYNTPLPTQDDPLKFVTLSFSEGGIAAKDVLIYGLKETLAFNATNTAKAEIVDTLVNMLDIEPSQIASIYSTIEQHPSFSDLVNVFLAERRYPQDEALEDKRAELTVKITIDIRNKVKLER